MKPYFFHSKSKVIPSINISHIEQLQPRIDWCNKHSERVHLDICDGKFVKNLTPSLSQLLSGEYKSWADVHLMVQNPLKMIKSESELIKINTVYFHKESEPNCLDLINFCHYHKINAGIALSLGSSVSSIKSFLSIIDCVLILTVNLGQTGGQFDKSSLIKIRELREIGFGGKIIVDGAITNLSIKEVKTFNPDGIISGNYIFADLNISSDRYLELDQILTN